MYRIWDFTSLKTLTEWHRLYSSLDAPTPILIHKILICSQFKQTTGRLFRVRVCLNCVVRQARRNTLRFWKRHNKVTKLTVGNYIHWIQFKGFYSHKTIVHATGLELLKQWMFWIAWCLQDIFTSKQLPVVG